MKLFADLDLLFDVRGNPLDYVIFRWPRAIPLYSPELYRHWFELERLLKEEYPHRQLFGNYTGQVSIRGMCEAAATELSNLKY